VAHLVHSPAWPDLTHRTLAGWRGLPISLTLIPHTRSRPTEKRAPNLSAPGLYACAWSRTLGSTGQARPPHHGSQPHQRMHRDSRLGRSGDLDRVVGRPWYKTVLWRASQTPFDPRQKANHRAAVEILEDRRPPTPISYSPGSWEARVVS
jgi:hypothetical protein